MTRPTRPSDLFSRSPLSCALLLATLTLTGCQGSANNSSSDATDTKAQKEEKKQNYEVIRRNRAPFSVVLPAGGRIQVVDLADERNQRVEKVVYDAKVPTNAVITVSPTGIRVNAVVKAPGPFQRNHTYEIRLIK